MAVADIIGAISGLGSLVDRIIKARDAIQIAELKMELQGKVVTALQSAAAANAHELEMSETIRDLKKQIMQLENWEAEKKRYTLAQLPPGVHVYALKPDEANGEPPHQICQACYQRGQKSILNRTETHSGVYHLRCPAKECGVDLTVGIRVMPDFGAAGRNLLGRR